MRDDDPFAGRQKRTVTRTRTEALAALKEHRASVHGTEDLDTFFDCAACGILESRLRNALVVATEEVPE